MGKERGGKEAVKGHGPRESRKGFVLQAHSVGGGKKGVSLCVNKFCCFCDAAESGRGGGREK